LHSQHSEKEKWHPHMFPKWVSSLRIDAKGQEDQIFEPIERWWCSLFEMMIRIGQNRNNPLTTTWYNEAVATVEVFYSLDE